MYTVLLYILVYVGRFAVHFLIIDFKVVQLCLNGFGNQSQSNGSKIGGA